MNCRELGLLLISSDFGPLVTFLDWATGFSPKHRLRTDYGWCGGGSVTPPGWRIKYKNKYKLFVYTYT